MPVRALAVLIVLLALAATVLAQGGGDSSVQVQPARRVGEYAGVSPSSDNTPPRRRAVQRARASTPPVRLVTWPGFVPNQGGGRFFLQLTSQVTPQTQASEGRFEVILPGVRTHVRNTRRPLLTRFFNTPVVKATVERRGRRRDQQLAFVFHLRAQVTPSVSANLGQNGYYFIFVDFPGGDYLPPDLRPSQPEPEPPSQPQRQTGDLPSNEEMRRMESERPPGM